MVDAGDAGIAAQGGYRVNPNFKVKGSGMRMGGGPQQFGVDSEQVPVLLADLAATDVDVVLHVFAGSQNLQAEILGEAQRRTVDLLLQLAQHCRQPVRYVNARRWLRHPLLRERRAARSGCGW